jgi:serine/threonine protein kinase
MSKCKACGKQLVKGKCQNKSCRAFSATSEPSGTIIPGGSDKSESIAASLGNIEPPVTGSEDSLDLLPRPRAEASEQLESNLTRQIDVDEEEAILFNLPAELESSEVPDSGWVQQVIMTQRYEPDSDDASPSGQEFVVPVRNVEIPLDSTLDSFGLLPTDARSGNEDDDPEGLGSPEFRFKKRLGKGGIGIVYEYEQISLKRSVALKYLKGSTNSALREAGKSSDLESSRDSGSRETREKLERLKNSFYREALLTARLEHPNIVPVHDFSMTPEGVHFYLMRKIDRSSWAAAMPQQELERNLEIFRDVCNALRFAHQQNVIHRDLKPENVMLGKFGEVYVVDWGLATETSKTGLQAGGTPPYMAPEMAQHSLETTRIKWLKQALARLDRADEKKRAEYELALRDSRTRKESSANKIGVPSDVYLLGAILFEILVGRPPHFVKPKDGESSNAKQIRELRRACAGKLPSSPFAQLSGAENKTREALYRIACKAMSIEPADRYQSVGELQEALEQYGKLLASFGLAEQARKNLAKARGESGYKNLLPALEAYRGALENWPDSPEIRQQQTEAACLYAERALLKKDFDAGLAVLDEYASGPELAPSGRTSELREQIVRGQSRRKFQRNALVAGWLLALIGLPSAIIGTTLYGRAELEKTRELTAIAETRSDLITDLNKITQESGLKLRAAEDKKRDYQDEVARLKKNRKDYLDEIRKNEKDVLKVQNEKDDLQVQNEKDDLQVQIAELEKKYSPLLDKSEQEKKALVELKAKLEDVLFAASTAKKWETDTNTKAAFDGVDEQLEDYKKSVREFSEILKTETAKQDNLELEERVKNLREKTKLNLVESDVSLKLASAIDQLNSKVVELEETRKRLPIRLLSQQFRSLEATLALAQQKVELADVEKAAELAAEEAKKNLENAKMELETTKGDQEKLKSEVKKTEKQLAGFKFDQYLNDLNTQIGKATSGLRTNRLADAREALRTARESKLSKLSGWEVSNLQQQAGASLNQVDEKIEICWVQPGEFVLGRKSTDNGEELVHVLLNTGEVRKLRILPENVSVRECSIANDANGKPRWLVVGLSYAKNPGLPWALYDLQNPSADVLDSEGIKDRMSCGLVRLNRLADNELELLSVEEESFRESTIDRIRVCVRKLQLNPQTNQWRVTAEPANVTLSGATSDETPVDYRATSARGIDGSYQVAVSAISDGKYGVQVTRIANDSSVTKPNKPWTLMEETVAPSLAIEEGNVSRLYAALSTGGVLRREISASESEVELQAGTERKLIDQDELRTNQPVEKLVLLPELAGPYRMILVHEGGELYAWNIGENGASNESRALRGHDRDIVFAAASASGKELITGDKASSFAVWEPSSNRTAAEVTVQSPDSAIKTVAVDRSVVGSSSPAVAYGKANGQIVYYSSEDLLKGKPPVVIESPFKEFSPTFSGLSSASKLGKDRLVLLDRDGYLTAWELQENGIDRQPVQKDVLVAEGAKKRRGFRPILAVPSKLNPDYFLTNDPMEADRIRVWTAGNSGRFDSQELDLPQLDGDEALSIEAISISPVDPQKVAVAVRSEDKTVRVRMMNLSNPNSAAPQLSYVDASPDSKSNSAPYRVDDPVFLQFSVDGNEVGFHRFEGDYIPETEFVRLSTNDLFTEGNPRNLNDRQEVSLRTWLGDAGGDTMVYSRNRRFQVVDFSADSKETDSASADPEPFAERAIDAQLFDQGLQLAVLKSAPDGNQGKTQLQVFKRSSVNKKFTLEENAGENAFDFDQAKSLRWIGGSEFLVFDRKGLHWVDLSGGKKELWLNRQVSCESLELSGNLLVAGYSNGESRLFRLPGSEPLRMPEGMRGAVLSPDGKSLTALVGGERAFWFNLDQPGEIAPPLMQPAGTGSVGCWVKSSTFAGVDGDFGWLAVGRDEAADGKLSWHLTSLGEAGLADKPLENLPREWRDGQAKLLDKLLELAVAPLSNDYIALRYETGEGVGKVEIASRRYVNIGERVSPDFKWISFPEDQGEKFDYNVSNVSLGELPVKTADDNGATTAVRLLVGERDGEVLKPRLYLLAKNWEVTPEVESGVAEASEFTGIFAETARAETGSLAFSANGRTILLWPSNQLSRERSFKLLQSAD